MEKQKIIQYIKDKYGDIFDVDASGNLTFKATKDISAFEMILVDSGSYQNGAGATVSIAPFYIGKYQVTQALYKSVMNKNPSRFQGVNRPVEKVSWFDAVKFCNTLNPNPICDENYNFINPQGQNTSLLTDVEGFRLPTEAEWEFAARGGKEFSENRLKYAGSNDMDVVGWYDKNNGYETKPVGLKLSNELGIFDMSGNVWEWCWDWYDDDFYNKQGTNPVNLKKGSDRVMRGGSWVINSHMQIANRYLNVPSYFWHDYGFRVVFCFFSSQLSQEKGNK